MSAHSYRIQKYGMWFVILLYSLVVVPWVLMLLVSAAEAGIPPVIEDQKCLDIGGYIVVHEGQTYCVLGENV